MFCPSASGYSGNATAGIKVFGKKSCSFKSVSLKQKVFTYGVGSFDMVSLTLSSL